MPLYLEDLAEIRCEVPNCESPEGHPIALSGKCHIGAPTRVYYHEGVVRVFCAVCKEPVADFAIACRPVN
jgi:hypothetical protein